MTLVQLERRLSLVEKKLADLSGDSKANSPDINAWIDQIHGTFQDDATYRKAARLGRQWRKSQRAPRARKPSK